MQFSSKQEFSAAERERKRPRKAIGGWSREAKEAVISRGPATPRPAPAEGRRLASHRSCPPVPTTPPSPYFTKARLGLRV